MDLSIITVNWNSVDYLRECISSIYEHTQDISFEIIVVDNASPAGNIEILKQLFPDMNIIKSDKNLGFAGANNLGFKHSSGKYILYINPDTKLVSPAINIMLDCLKSLPDVGIVGCKLLNADLSVQTSCIQKYPTIANQIADIEWLRLRWPNFGLWEIGPLFSSYGRPSKVEVISGACMMVKRSVFERVGPFSEDYFMYAEDLDLCYKVAHSGLANYYIGQATVIHYGGKSSSPQWATIMKMKSILRFCVKTRGRLYGLVYRVTMSFNAVGRLIILVLMLPFGNVILDRKILHSALEKWVVIFKWAVGCKNPVLRSAINP